MTDDDKALKWLDDVIGQPVCFAGERTHARRIREMLGRPAMPEMREAEPAFEAALQAMRDGCPGISAWLAYSALYRHLDPPKTKTAGCRTCGDPTATSCTRRGCPTYLNDDETVGDRIARIEGVLRGMGQLP